MKRKKILVISHDKIGESMAGPGIRYHQIANRLAEEHNVTIAAFNPKYLGKVKGSSYDLLSIPVHDFRRYFKGFDTIIALWLNDEMIEYAKKEDIRLIFDLYAPVPVEDLVQRVYGKRTGRDSDYEYVSMLSSYSHMLKNGDYFLTSNEQQKDFWVGYAFASGKTSPSKQSLRPVDDYFGICPMGIDLSEVRAVSHNALSERIPSIADDDFVIVWTGGIWDWFDGITPIKAVKKLVDGGDKRIKLVFLGTKHPNDDVPAMSETNKSIELATSLGLVDENVFFLPGWLPYRERVNYLMRADIALYAHKPSIEARFSHRTRVLDHILMQLPTVATSGDYLSDYIEKESMGLIVAPFDVDGMTEAIGQLSVNSTKVIEIKKRIRANQEKFTWKNTLADLVEFCARDNLDIEKYTAKNTDSDASAASHISDLLPKGFKKFIPKGIKKIAKKVLNNK